MKKLIVLLMLVFLVGCNPSTTTNNPVTNITTEGNSNLITTNISDDITMVLNIGLDTVEINTAWTDMRAYIMINGEMYAMTTDSLVDINVIGNYQITYSYVFEGETYSINRYVAVVDQTKPVITLNPGIDTVSLGETWIDAGVNVADNSGEVLNIQISGTVDTNTSGTYLITYQVNDSSINTSTVTRYVNVLG